MAAAPPASVTLIDQRGESLAVEYKYVTLPVGSIPRSVGFDAVVSMELNEYAAKGWRVSSVTRLGLGTTPMAVVFERATSD